MKTILKKHTRTQISNKCGVSYRTVLNWIKLETIPLWAIKKLGFCVKAEKKQLKKDEKFLDSLDKNP